MLSADLILVSLVVFPRWCAALHCAVMCCAEPPDLDCLDHRYFLGEVNRSVGWSPLVWAAARLGGVGRACLGMVRTVLARGEPDDAIGGGGLAGRWEAARDDPPAGGRAL